MNFCVNILHRQAFSIPLGKYLKVEMLESFNKCIRNPIKQFSKTDVQLCIFDKTWKFLLLIVAVLFCFNNLHFTNDYGY